MKLKVCLASVGLACASHLWADVHSHGQGVSQGPRADDHAPIHIMGDHMHSKGEWMVSYRLMNMSMSGNLQGSSSVSPDTIATTVPNRFFGMPGMPPTLRVVPLEMDTQMHMLGMMYAPSDRYTLMAMLNYIDKSMTLRTFQGGMGTNVIGDWESESSGFGDIKVGSLIRLKAAGAHHWHANMMLSLPTGSITERGTALTPMDMTIATRLPYAMQLGSGTYDLIPGVTYTGKQSDWAWSAQLKATVRTGENDEGYTLGDEYLGSTWLQYSVSSAVALSSGLSYRHRDDISGIDEQILLPVQTANPVNYGGTLILMSFGVNWVSTTGHRVAGSYQLPLDEKVNGVHMEYDSMLTLGYQYAF